MERIKHNARGSSYSLLGQAKFQVSSRVPHANLTGHSVYDERAGEHRKVRIITDGDEVKVYQSEEDGALYARFPDEFTADRFTPLEDGISDRERIENACQAASETHSSWEARCYAILAALGLNFGKAPGPENDAYRAVDPLYRHVRKFITTQEITCAETIYQVDRVIEHGYEFIEGCCRITGYHKHEDEA